MSQLLLFPDPRPLVDRLGAQFFRDAPEAPGVYLMRDAGDTVLYVGKAKNLRKRLMSYRVANPERLRPRHLRLLRAVARIEFERCLDESDALSRESQLLRHLRPRFNRAGTWPTERRFLAWQQSGVSLHFAVTVGVEPGWAFCGPLGIGAFQLRTALLRLLWCALHPDNGLATLPQGWFLDRRDPVITLRATSVAAQELEHVRLHLESFSNHDSAPLVTWIGERTLRQIGRFETTLRELDLEMLAEHRNTRRAGSQDPVTEANPQIL